MQSARSRDAKLILQYAIAVSRSSITKKSKVRNILHRLLSQGSFEEIPDEDTHDKDDHEDDNSDKYADAANQACAKANGSGSKE
jgi:hypothetical protein